MHNFVSKCYDVIMHTPKISAIAAITKKDRSIGHDGKLMFRISDDLKRFKELTSGHPVIMGRKTFESIGRLLPKRTNYIVTRNKHWLVDGAIMCYSVEEAIEKAAAEESKGPSAKKEVFLIGGGEIYKQGLPFTSKLYLTIIDSDAVGDVCFPDYSDFKKETLHEERFDETAGLRYAWIDLER